ncbi:MAG: ATP-binding protein [Muribaculaceae bacterium]|nr:ATP-binding protein [Muribaculaceae bacterium]
MKYPIGIQTFEQIRHGGYVYIDKTAEIYDLISRGKYYFLSRPRRFGKSLLVSTLDCYFSGRRDLFEGLDICSYENEWAKYPVIHIDLNIGEYYKKDGLETLLSSILDKYERQYGVETARDSIADRFANLIRIASESCGMGVVVLVDEYDKPLLESIGDEDLQNHFRRVLKPFYGVLKSCDRYLRFGFLTGVTKIGRMSVFSDLNNLIDISMNDDYASRCGITSEEMLRVFTGRIKEMAAIHGISFEEMVKKLTEMYDGYRFTEKDVKIFNPFSLLNAFYEGKLRPYWFSTGTPSYLANLLKSECFNLWHIDKVEEDIGNLTSINSFESNPIPLIYQSGYLTIKHFDDRFNSVILGFPNIEVKNGFLNSLLPIFASESVDGNMSLRKMVLALDKGDIDSFMTMLQSLLSSLPYAETPNFDYEAQYRNVMYIILTLLGAYVESERHIACGRIDLVASTHNAIYIMEFKTSGTADEAVRQIEVKNYDLPYRTDSRPIVRVGAVFNASMHTISEWVSVS